VRWDPQYTCRYWQLVRANGTQFDGDARIHSVAVQAVSKTGEMTMSKTFLGGLRALGYTDLEIAQNMLWLYENSLHVYAEAFPSKRFGMNMGRIPVSDGTQEATYAILDAIVATYGTRVSFGTTGFGGARAELLTRYRDRVSVGGLSEKPAKESPDPVAELTQIFDLVWPSGTRVGWVSLHADALGIHPLQWSDLQPLKDFLDDVDSTFAVERAADRPRLLNLK
jgi:hypothetical protein